MPREWVRALGLTRSTLQRTAIGPQAIREDRSDLGVTRHALQRVGIGRRALWEDGSGLVPYRKIDRASGAAGCALQRAGIGPQALQEDGSGLGAMGRDLQKEDLESGSTTEPRLKY